MHDIGNRMGFKVNQIGPVHPTVEGGYQAALALEGGDTTAIITYNDLIAVGIVLRFTADGVNVPGDVSVIGFDNTLIAPVVTPPITSIRIPRVQPSAADDDIADDPAGGVPVDSGDAVRHIRVRLLAVYLGDDA